MPLLKQTTDFPFRLIENHYYPTRLRLVRTMPRVYHRTRLPTAPCGAWRIQQVFHASHVLAQALEACQEQPGQPRFQLHYCNVHLSASAVKTPPQVTDHRRSRDKEQIRKESGDDHNRKRHVT